MSGFVEKVNTVATFIDGVNDELHTLVDEATTQANSASDSATTATNEANIATTQAGIATTQAGIATTKATSATASATSATSSAQSASDSATLATTKANSATSSATTATTQAGIATTKASEASASATNASNSASSASTSEGNALSYKTSAYNYSVNSANSATDSASSASLAQGYASSASSSANSATSSASSASTSASNANSSANSAANSASSTAALLATFRSVFLGTFTSDANAVSFATANSITITDGIMYENTVSDKFRIYNGTAWQDYDSSAQASQSAAALSAANAASSAGSASASATSASNSASSASTSATNASNSASSASTSASNASTSATNAHNSELAAAQSATSAANTVAPFTTHITNTSNPHSVTKSQVGLGNVDNTSDVNKPISTATQTALNSKANSATTLSGYGITDAYTKTEINTLASNYETTADLTANYYNKTQVDTFKNNYAPLAGATFTGAVTGTSFNSITALSSTSPSNIGTATVGTSTTVARADHTHDLPSSGVTAGTYKSVTVDTKGRVTSATNPTTLSGFGITDAFTQSDLTMAIGNINSPLLDMPLKNSLTMKSGVGSATFTRASTATYIDRYGVLKTAAIDEPRFEAEGYLNEGGSTNLCLYSEQFDNAYWGKARSTVSSNTTATTDPYGTNFADKFIEDTTTIDHVIYKLNITTAASTLHTWSVFVKAGERSYIGINAFGGTTDAITYFNLTNGTISSLASGCTAKIEQLSNGWYRCSVNRVTETTTPRFELYLSINGTSNSYAGDGTSGLYIFGAQLEALPFATSYIPTTSATVTRAKDNLFVTMVGNSAGYNNRYSTETLSVDYNPFGFMNYAYPFEFNGATTCYRSYVGSTGGSVVQYGSDGVGGSQLSTGTLSLGINNRLAISHNSLGVTKGYLNGVLKATGTSGNADTTGVCTGIYIGSSYNGTGGTYGHISNFRIWDKALTAQEVTLA